MAILEDVTDEQPVPDDPSSPFLGEPTVPFTVEAHQVRQQPPPDRFAALLDVADRARVGIGFAVGLLIVGALLLAYRSQGSESDTSSSATTALAQAQPAAPALVEASPGAESPATTALALPPITDQARLDRLGAEAGGSTGLPTTRATGPTSSESVTTTSRPEPSSTATTATPTTPAPTTTTPTTTTTQAPTTAAPQIVVRADTFEIEEGKEKSLKVLDNDESIDSKLDKDSLEITVAPRHAESYRVRDGRIRYRSLEDFEGTDTLTYRVCDRASTCGSATVTIIITD